MNAYKELTLGLIDEGRFVAQADEELLEMQEHLSQMLAKHGPDSKGLKAELQIKLQLCIEDPKNEHFSIKCQTKRVLPHNPAVVTMAIGDRSKSDRVFVRCSGSTEDSPRQGVMFTEDGRQVETVTHD